MNKKIIFIIIILIASLLYFGVKDDKKSDLSSNLNESYNTNNKNINQNIENEYNKLLEFLKNIDGLEIKNATFIKEPVGINSIISAPKDAILKGVKSFLKDNPNFDEINIITKDGYLDIFTKYNLKGVMTTIQAKLYVSLDEAKNLILNIKDLKFLDINISDWILDFTLTTFCKDIFSKNENLNINIDKGNIIIYKDNFEKISLNNILIKEDSLELDMFIDLEKILKG